MSAALENVAVFPVPGEERQGEQRKRDNDGLHKRRGIWHTRVKIDGRWRELSLSTRSYQQARKDRPQKVAAFEEQHVIASPSQTQRSTPKRRVAYPCRPTSAVSCR